MADEDREIQAAGVDEVRMLQISVLRDFFIIERWRGEDIKIFQTASWVTRSLYAPAPA